MLSLNPSSVREMLETGKPTRMRHKGFRMNASSYQHIRAWTQEKTLIVELLPTDIRDPHLCQTLGVEMREAQQAADHVLLVLDMQHVAFVASTGMLAFFQLQKDRGDRTMVLCNLSDPLIGMFRVCRLIPGSSGKPAPFGYSDDIATAIEQSNQAS